MAPAAPSRVQRTDRSGGRMTTRSSSTKAHAGPNGSFDRVACHRGGIGSARAGQSKTGSRRASAPPPRSTLAGVTAGSRRAAARRPTGESEANSALRRRHGSSGSAPESAAIRAAGKRHVASDGNVERNGRSRTRRRRRQGGPRPWDRARRAVKNSGRSSLATGEWQRERVAR